MERVVILSVCAALAFGRVGKGIGNDECKCTLLPMNCVSAENVGSQSERREKEGNMGCNGKWRVMQKRVMTCENDEVVEGEESQECDAMRM